MVVAFQENADPTARFAEPRRREENELILKVQLQLPSPISREIPGPRFAASSRLKRDGHCHCPALAWRRLPLPKRLKSGLVKIGVAGGFNDLNVREVASCIETQT